MRYEETGALLSSPTLLRKTTTKIRKRIFRFGGCVLLTPVLFPVILADCPLIFLCALYTSISLCAVHTTAFPVLFAGPLLGLFLLL